MALATVIIKETNLVGAVVSPAGAGVTLGNSNMGILDTPETTLSTAYAIPAAAHPAGYSYEKWQRLNVYANASGNTISGIRVWRTGSLGSVSDTHMCNCRTAAQTGYLGAAAYSTPLLTQTVLASWAMPTSDPGAANLGIGGSLTGTITAVGSSFSDYLVHQIHVDASTTAGPAAANTLYFQYDEYA